MTDSQYNSVNDTRRQLLSQWLKQISVSYDSLFALTTDAGSRRYFRLHSGTSSVLAVDANPEFEDTRAFLDIAKRISASGIRVPVIYHYNLEKGFLVIEDLGDTHVQLHCSRDAASTPGLYTTAMQDLLTLQQQTLTHDLPRFNSSFIRLELSIFEDWYLQKHLARTLTATQKQTLEQLYALIIENSNEQPQVFMHRDYHCRNLMVVENQQLAVIDFQGAMHGPATYDPGSLLKDAYVTTDRPLHDALCETHRQSLQPLVTTDQYRRWYDITALQRHLKILGIFCRLNYRDNKPHYMSHLSSVSHHIHQTLQAYTDLHGFHRLFTQLSPVNLQA